MALDVVDYNVQFTDLTPHTPNQTVLLRGKNKFWIY